MSIPKPKLAQRYFDMIPETVGGIEFFVQGIKKVREEAQKEVIRFRALPDGEEYKSALKMVNESDLILIAADYKIQVKTQSIKRHAEAKRHG